MEVKENISSKQPPRDHMLFRGEGPQPLTMLVPVGLLLRIGIGQSLGVLILKHGHPQSETPGCVSLSGSLLSPPGCLFPPEDVLYASVEYSPSHTTPALLMCGFHTQAVNQPLIQKVPRKTVSMGSAQQHRGLSGCLLRRHPIWAPDRVPVAPVLIHLLVNTAGKATEGSPSAWVPCHSHGKPR